MIETVTFKDFQKKGSFYYLDKASNVGGLLVVKADWCGHCKRLFPILEDVSKKLGKAYLIFKLDADSNPDIVSSLGVKGFPTIFYIERDGKISEQYKDDRSEFSILNNICKKSLVCKK